MQRALLAILLILIPASFASPAPPEPATSASGVPIVGTGKALPEFDEAIVGYLERAECTAATFALSVGGKVVYARGYGWLDLEKKRPAPVDTPMRVASVSKPITAAAIRKLIAADKLADDTKVWPLLNLDPPAGVELDPRWKAITGRGTA